MKMKSGFLKLLFVASCLIPVSGCSANDNGTLHDASFYETDAVFNVTADLPPNPLDDDALQLYKALGMTNCILTEDSVSFIQTDKDEEGNVTGSSMSEEYKNAIRNIGENGLECWIRNMYNDPDYFQNDDPDKQRSNYGTPYTLSTRNITDEFSEFENVTGFYMSDEPYMTSDLPFINGELTEGCGYEYAAMDQYQKLVDWKNRYYPEATWHMNHVPSSSYNHWPATYTYKQFLEYYAENILGKITGNCTKYLSLDNYPFGDVEPEIIAQDYLYDVLCAAEVVRDYNDAHEDKATFGMCVQSFKNLGSPTLIRYSENYTEILYQLNTCMAMGARSFEYFCYKSLTGVKLYGILDEDGLPTDEYYHVKEANEKALGMAKIMNSFDWRNFLVSYANDTGDVENATAFDRVEGITDPDDRGCLESFSSRLDAGIGYFQNGKTDGYMITNQSAPILGQTNTVKVNFGTSNKKVLVYKNGESSVVKLLDGTYQVNLGPGEAVFVIPGK